jgi:hypothetical protein
LKSALSCWRCDMLLRGSQHRRLASSQQTGTRRNQVPWWSPGGGQPSSAVLRVLSIHDNPYGPGVATKRQISGDAELVSDPAPSAFRRRRQLGANGRAAIGELGMTTHPIGGRDDDITDPAMAEVTEELPAQQISDAAIIERSLREPECFAAIFDRYYGVIHGYAARRLGPALADDVAAETFLIAFAARQKYDCSRPEARPWLFGIACNLIARHARAEVREYRALARACVPETAEGDPDRIEGRLDAQAYRGRSRPRWRKSPRVTGMCCCWSPGRS